MPRKRDERVQTAVRLDRLLHDEAVAACEDLDVSLSWLVARLVRQWLDHPGRPRGPLNLLATPAARCPDVDPATGLQCTRNVHAGQHLNRSRGPANSAGFPDFVDTRWEES